MAQLMRISVACALYSVWLIGFSSKAADYIATLKGFEDLTVAPPMQTEEWMHWTTLQDMLCESLAADAAGGVLQMQASDRLRASAKAIGLDMHRSVTKHDLQQVKFHRYFVVALDRAGYDLATLSPWALLLLCTWSCCIAMVASYARLSFAWILPCMILLLIILFCCLRGCKRFLSTANMLHCCKWLPITTFVVGAQAALFISCYSVSWLTLTPSAWTESGWLCFVTSSLLTILGTFARDCSTSLFIRLLCMLSLPPAASTRVLEEYLQAMAALVPCCKT